MRPLDDLTVIDISVTLPGPYASKLLAQLGADVVSVEPPGGDPLKSRGPKLEDGTGKTYATLNRGKETIEVDLKDDRGRDLLTDLAAGADVFVEGFAPGAVERLGVGPGRLRSVNEELVYCSLSGFGQDGPRREQPGHALNYEALAGSMDPRDPSLPRVPVGDLAGGSMLALAVLAAVRNRDRGGGGQYVDLGLFEIVASWNLWNAPWAESDAETDYDPLVGGEYPCYNTYEAADGRYLSLGAMEEHFWEQLCEALDVPDLADEQFATGGQESEPYQRVQERFEQKSAEEWVERLSADLPVAMVKSPGEAVEDPQLLARNGTFLVDTTTGETIRDFGFPVTFSELTTGTDENGGDSLFVAAGYDAEKLEALREAGVLSDADR